MRTAVTLTLAAIVGVAALGRRPTTPASTPGPSAQSSDPTRDGHASIVPAGAPRSCVEGVSVAGKPLWVVESLELLRVACDWARIERWNECQALIRRAVAIMPVDGYDRDQRGAAGELRRLCTDWRTRVMTDPLFGEDLGYTACAKVAPPAGCDIPGVGLAEVDEFADAFPGSEVGPKFLASDDAPPRDPVVDEYIRALLDEAFDLRREGRHDAALARFDRALAMRPSRDIAYTAIKRVGEDAIALMMTSSDEREKGIGYRLFEHAYAR